jgi:TonB family protein
VEGASDRGEAFALEEPLAVELEPPAEPVEPLASFSAPSVADLRRHYALQIMERIAGAIEYPQTDWPVEAPGHVKLLLHLDRAGSLTESLVTEDSGVAEFDEEALRVARAQSPYPAFPEELPEQDLWLDIPVLFDKD